MNKPLIIDYYSDILCVWAWITQRRIEEVNLSLKGKVEFHYHYVDIFGDTHTKMLEQWQAKGGYEGFAKHVQQSASGYGSAPVNPKIWTEVRPVTSANAHLILKAIELSYDREKSIEIALKLREAFFVDALDIGKLDVLYDLVADNDLDHTLIDAHVQAGSAIAALMHDHQQCKQQNLKGSPSYVIDGGRQILYGNVGYRVLHANIDELAKKPQEEASWC
ncbi:MAG: DsbA family protein [Porticoccaceae bacterium]|nr:DsbA family protein [Porticoccaceae bacterium]